MTDIVATEEAQQNEAALPENLPGKQLKEAREKLKLSTQDVSDKMNLKHSFVQQIEEDNYTLLPGATFVRGYIRAYAKLVGIDGEPLVESYNASFDSNQKPEQRYQPVETIKPQRSFSDPVIKYTTVIVVAVLIGLSLMWWQSRNSLGPFESLQNDTVAVETSEGETVIAQMDLSGASDDAAQEAAAEASQGETEETLQEHSATDGVEDAEGSSESTQDSESAENAQPVDGGPEHAPEAEIAEEQAPAAATITPSVPEKINQSGMSEVRFTINFTADCWVQVTDARGIKVVSNLKHEGEESVVEGLPPFKLMIGNAGGAVVRYQGEIVDLKPHTNSNNIARFTLGK